MKKLVNGVLVDLTPNEIAEREAEEQRQQEHPVLETRDLLKELDELKFKIEKLEKK